MKLESIAIRNLRSLADTKTISLRPLTLVVGENSSGKSTFIRTFALLRQSVEIITKGPLLWYGRLVDFGVFDDAVTRGIENREIELEFTIRLDQSTNLRIPRYIPPFFTVLEDLSAVVTLVVAETPEKGSTYTRRIKISLSDHVIEINASPEGSVESFLLDGKPLERPTTDLRIWGGDSLFKIEVLLKSSSSSQTPRLTQNTEYTFAFSRCYNQLLRLADELFHGATLPETKAIFVHCLGIGSKTCLLDQVRDLAATTRTSSQRAAMMNTSSKWLQDLQGLVLADRIPQLLNYIDSFLSKSFRNVSYIGPLRATAERYYRQQDLGVDEVDPQGTNLAMFLMGLSSSEQVAFSSWCETNIGFTVESKSIGSHVSINLGETSSGDVFNVADMGFGYSQLLPVLATIWSSVRYESIRSPKMPTPARSLPIFTAIPARIIAIEQPELLLHPRFQGKLASLLCAIANESDGTEARLHLICETHSETIVNQVGKLVALRKIDPSQVQVLLFEKKEGESFSTVRKAEFDSKGVLLNWPYGFFLPAHDLEGAYH
jgi:energy-coupling factor transporter ATP-binding protein EcfA2